MQVATAMCSGTRFMRLASLASRQLLGSQLLGMTSAKYPCLPRVPGDLGLVPAQRLRLPCSAERRVPQRRLGTGADRRRTPAGEAGRAITLTPQNDRKRTVAVERAKIKATSQVLNPRAEILPPESGAAGLLSLQPEETRGPEFSKLLKEAEGLSSLHVAGPDTLPQLLQTSLAGASAQGEGASVGSQAVNKFPLFKLPKDLLPPSRVVRVKSAEFIKSSADVAQCPQDGYPEIAVIGRSNVGKSSLINMLTNRRELAQTSKKPGKTQLINHFLINSNWYLVDLPGYGYAKAPNAVREDWHAFTQKYFLNRPSLVTVLLLVDASVPPLQVDLDCADWMGQNKIPLTIVFTKCDRRKKRKNGGRPPAENVAEFEQQLSQVYEEPPPWIMTSSAVSMGKDTLLGHISQVISHWKT